MPRTWALIRRAQYFFGAFILLSLLGGGLYFLYLYQTPSCFDDTMNGEERGVDCGGACTRICSFDIAEPAVLWSRAFKIVDGQYNAVAYVKNENYKAGTPLLGYTLKLYDRNGLILEQPGTTVLPPNSVYPIFAGRLNTGNRVPTQTTIEFDYESAVWLPATAGREQFRVEKRELKGADSSPKLYASITNTMLEEAKEVEIVATIFDTSGNALTTSSTYVDYFAGRTTKDIVFTWPMPIATSMRSCEVPTDVLLAIDLSGSMNDDGGTPQEPITSVLTAAEAFISRLKDKDRVGIVTYATKAALVEPLTSERIRVADVVRDLAIAKAEETGSTNTGDAIKVARQEFDSSRHNPDARKVLVLLSDGLANAPEGNPEAYALGEASELKANAVNVYTIGLGGKVNDIFLKGIASQDAQYLKAATKERVDSIYRTITASICEDGPAVIEIIPKNTAVFAPLK